MNLGASPHREEVLIHFPMKVLQYQRTVSNEIQRKYSPEVWGI